MSFSGMLRHVAHVRKFISEERTTSIIRVTRIGKLTSYCCIVPSSLLLVTLMMEAIHSSKTIGS
jgi:hypothetical protein